MTAALQSVALIEPAPLRIALAGNPNCGKTSLFNALTGARQRVGNYPGVTVERRIGHVRHQGRELSLIDLPGAYSLSSWSPEEHIARDELLGDTPPDLVVVVADATNLARSLVLLVQVMHAGANAVLCLNMSDEARHGGQRLDVARMRALLGIEVVETVAHRGHGVDELLAAIGRAATCNAERPSLAFSELDRYLDPLRARLRDIWPHPERHAWVAARLLSGDPALEDRLQQLGAPGRAVLQQAQIQRQTIHEDTGADSAVKVADAYFGFVDGLLRDVTLARAREDARQTSDRVDSVLAHRVLGLPIFAALMYAVFWLTFTLGEAPMGWIEAGFSHLADAISGLWSAGSASPLRSLIVDGIIGGVGGVLIFLPNIVLLFAGLALLEDSGYMARAAFLMDRVMERFGLHGKSFLPMMTGFGCSVPGIMATRTLENERDRLTTMLVLPLMSCGARLPIWLLLVPAFFAPHLRAPVLWLIYVFGILVALCLAKLLRRTVLAGADAPFVMELPPYRLPTLRGALRKVLERGGLYVRKAGTVILAISIVMWFLAAFPKTDTYVVDARVAAGEVQLSAAELEAARASEDLEHSFAGRIGHALEPVMKPLGFDWKLSTAMVGAFAAKEVFVAQLGVVYSLAPGDDGGGSDGLQVAISRDYSPLVGLSLIIFLLVSAPCMATVAVTRRESGSWRWAFLQLGGLTVVAWLLAFVVFQLGSLFA